MWAKLTTKDLGWDRFTEVLKILKGTHYVKVGVIGQRAVQERDGITNQELAAIHEYGRADGHIPPRPFLRSTFDLNKDRYIEQVTRMLGAIMDGKMTVNQALGILGATIVTDIKARVMQGVGIPPPNAPSTIKRKGSSRPLVNTGRMIAALAWEVVGK